MRGQQGDTGAGSQGHREVAAGTQGQQGHRGSSSRDTGGQQQGHRGSRDTRGSTGRGHAVSGGWGARQGARQLRPAQTEACLPVQERSRWRGVVRPAAVVVARALRRRAVCSTASCAQLPAASKPWCSTHTHTHTQSAQRSRHSRAPPVPLLSWAPPGTAGCVAACCRGLLTLSRQR